jgi:hypothetical protein
MRAESFLVERYAEHDQSGKLPRFVPTKHRYARFATNKESTISAKAITG